MVRCLGKGPGRGKRPRNMDVWTFESVYPPPRSDFSPVPEIYDHHLDTSGGGSDCFGWIVWLASLSGGRIDHRNRVGGLSGGRIGVERLLLIPSLCPKHDTCLPFRLGGGDPGSPFQSIFFLAGLDASRHK